MSIEYSGYWLYKEEIEKHWPKQQRLKRDGSKQITREGLDAIIRRAEQQQPPLCITETKALTTKVE